MSTPTAPAPRPDSRRVAESYAQGADLYHRHWAPVLLGPATRLVDPLPLAGARVVIDAAAGTGILLPALARRAPSATVVASDLTRGMLELATGHPRVQADCTRLPFRDGVADAIVFAFVLFHVPDRPAALAEAMRVLRPGGWVATATWEARDESPFDEALFGEIDASGVPPVPPLRNDEGIDSEAGVAALLTAAGFTDVGTELTRIDYRPTVEDYLTLRCGSMAVRTRLGQLPPEQRDAIVDRARRRLLALPPDQLVDRSQVVLGRARRP